MGKLPSGNLTLCHEAVARVSGRRRGAGGRTHPSQFCCGGRRRDPHCGPRSQCHRQRGGPVGRLHGLSAWPARPAQARKPRPRGRLHPRSPPHCVSSVAHPQPRQSHTVPLVASLSPLRRAASPLLKDAANPEATFTLPLPAPAPVSRSRNGDGARASGSRIPLLKDALAAEVLLQGGRDSGLQHVLVFRFRSWPRSVVARELPVAHLGHGSNGLQYRPTVLVLALLLGHG